MHVKQLLGPSAQPVMPGTVLSIIDNLEFDATDCWSPRILWVAGNIYAVAYQDLADDCVIVTVEITPDGLIGAAVIDSAVVAATTTQMLDMVRIGGTNVFAIAYSGAGSDGFISTITINSDGTIGAVIDTLEYDGAYGLYPALINVSGDIYAIFYLAAGSASVVTVDIDTAGNIGAAVIDTLLMGEGGTSLFPTIINISGTVFAAVYYLTGAGNGARVRTFDIDAAGNIGAAVIDSLEFVATDGREPEIINVSGTIYAIVYGGPGSDGWLVTLDIDNAGNIGAAIIDSFEFDYTYGRDARIVNISGELFTIFYFGNPRGLIATVTIDATGTIAGVRWRQGGGALLDTSARFNATFGGNPDAVAVTTNIYAIAYKGPVSGASGQLTTVRINS